jgi:hypothetical protein
MTWCPNAEYKKNLERDNMLQIARGSEILYHEYDDDYGWVDVYFYPYIDSQARYIHNLDHYLKENHNCRLRRATHQDTITVQFKSKEDMFEFKLLNGDIDLSDLLSSKWQD